MSNVCAGLVIAIAVIIFMELLVRAAEHEACIKYDRELQRSYYDSEACK